MSRFTFFRQSGWMLLATVTGGAFMWAVHPLLNKQVSELPLGAFTDFLMGFVKVPMDKSDYALFYTLLSLLNLMAIPGVGLQTVFAQQAAAAINDQQERQLRGTVRAVLAGTFVIWLASLVVVFTLRQAMAVELKIDRPASLWVTIFIGLPILWLPVLQGVLQGRQNFLWLGWTAILGGAGRCVTIAIIVRVIGAQVAGAMTGVLSGVGLAMMICLWQVASIWRGPGEAFAWRAWLKRVVPLTLGLGAATFMLSADALVVRSLFRHQGELTGLYSAAGIIGRALVFFTVPMAAVMFPKIVQSAAKSERTDVLAQALGATALLGGVAALLCTLFPALPLRLVYDKSFLAIAPLVPWFAWCMLPLTLGNVLINNLLARERFRAVPWLVGVAAAYGLTLLICSNKLVQLEPLSAFKVVVQILGAFSLLLLVVAALFTARKN